MMSNDTVMTVVIDGLEQFPRKVTIDGKEYNAMSASIYDEIQRANLLENIIASLIWNDIIDDEKLISIGVTQKEIDGLCMDTSILEDRGSNNV